MTIEDFGKAKTLIAEIQSLDNNISELQHLLDNPTLQDWRMEIRPNVSYSLKLIDHKGLLADFLKAVLDKHISEKNELMSKFEAL